MANKPSKWAISDDEFERQFAAATQRGKAERAKGVHATAARYDKVTKRIIVELANGATLIIPAQLMQGLQNATAKELAEIEILGVGSGLYWPQLEADISVAGLLQGIFGSKSWMTELGRAGGKVTSEKKQTAAQANGKLGGRPKSKVAPVTKSSRLKKAA
jgi:Protein of unknown function (DUF2442)